MDNELTIARTIKGLPRLRVFDEQLEEYEKLNPFKNQYPVVDKQTYLGIEVEVENVRKFDSHLAPYWNSTEDGSLRNRGVEFLTPPIRAWRIEQALTVLFNQQLNNDVDFSDRTSIHVHMNVRTLTVKQLETLILCYLTFEKTLFSFVGNNRYENIFCTPICESNFSVQIRQLIAGDVTRVNWKKYTALNLLPIMEKGTIEFRHLHGTKDVGKIMCWINLLLSLKKYALKNKPEAIWTRIGSLNTTSEYYQLTTEVFGDLTSLLDTKTLGKQVGSCISLIKSQCIINPFMEKITEITSKSKLIKVKGLLERANKRVSLGPSTIMSTPGSMNISSFFDSSSFENPVSTERVRDWLNATGAIPVTLNTDF